MKILARNAVGMTLEADSNVFSTLSASATNLGHRNERNPLLCVYSFKKCFFVHTILVITKPAITGAVVVGKQLVMVHLASQNIVDIVVLVVQMLLVVVEQ